MSYSKLYSSDFKKQRDLTLLLNDYQATAILGYINEYNAQQNKKEPEDRKGLTKDTVAREMYSRNVCSRLTTLRILRDLLISELIVDKKETEKKFSRLEINKTTNWLQLRRELLVSEILKALRPFNNIIDKTPLNITISWDREGKPKIHIKEMIETRRRELTA